MSVESVSIFKNEVEAAHELFRRCQHIALDFFKRPWRVNVELIDDKNRKTNNNEKDECCEDNRRRSFRRKFHAASIR